MSAIELIASIGLGVGAELALYLLLTRIIRLSGKSAAMIVALLILLIYMPWGLINWPGADIFAVHLAIFLTLAYGLGMLSGKSEKSWHWAPALIVSFFVGVVVINIVFLTVAEQGIQGFFREILPTPRNAQIADSAFPGVVSHDFQEKEALYNTYLAEVEEQKNRGWQVDKGWRNQPQAGLPTELIVQVRDRFGRPISGAKVEGTFLRTSNSRDDFTFTLSEEATGDYRGDITMPLAGLWRMVLNIERGADRHEIRATTSVIANAP
jgi:nitrogen fixation protein FixH